MYREKQNRDRAGSYSEGGTGDACLGGQNHTLTGVDVMTTLQLLARICDFMLGQRKVGGFKIS